MNRLDDRVRSERRCIAGSLHLLRHKELRGAHAFLDRRATLGPSRRVPLLRAL